MSTYTDDPRVIEFDVRTDEMLVNMGPQHPSTHGVLRLVLRTDGEIVSQVETGAGILIRAVSKDGGLPEGAKPVEDPTLEEAYLAFMAARGRADAAQEEVES